MTGFRKNQNRAADNLLRRKFFSQRQMDGPEVLSCSS
jgi:hypothetical protein